MNKKTIVIFGAILFSLSFTVPQVVTAVSLHITSTGAVTIYSGEVLGDEIEIEKEREVEKETEMESAELEREEQKKLQEKKVETKRIRNEQEGERANREAEVEKKEERKLLKSLPAQSKEKIRIKEGKKAIEVELEDADQRRKSKEPVKRFEDEHLEASFPAQLKLKTEDNEDKNEASTERESRRDENVALRASKTASGAGEFELESRSIRAKSQGAEFLLDPETNQIVLTTPSGNQHVLRHLPDQAIENMLEKGFINDGETPELEITELPTGEVGYKAKIIRNKKLFGLFSREVEAELLMSDQNQTIIEQETDNSLGATILNWLSTD